MHPATLWSLAVDSHRENLLRQAAEARVPYRRQALGYDETPVVIRLATPGDAAAVARLEALDARRLPDGPALLAEVEGAVVAALDVVSSTAVADPFVPTADVVRLLELRAGQLRDGGEAGSQLRRAGRMLRSLIPAVAESRDGRAA